MKASSVHLNREYSLFDSEMKIRQAVIQEISALSPENSVNEATFQIATPLKSEPVVSISSVRKLRERQTEQYIQELEERVDECEAEMLRMNIDMKLQLHEIQTDIELGLSSNIPINDDAAKQIDYWRNRALLAENRVSQLQSILEQDEEEEPVIITPSKRRNNRKNRPSSVAITTWEPTTNQQDGSEEGLFTRLLRMGRGIRTSMDQSKIVTSEERVWSMTSSVIALPAEVIK